MSSCDTQWPRWEVFKQDSPKRTHQAVGTVHAADAEHALLAARNVFARRPKVFSLWVAPADAVLTVTREALERASGEVMAAEPTRDLEPAGASAQHRARYQVFCKTSQRPSLAFADYQGELEAETLSDALEQARQVFSISTPLAWMIVPEATIVRTQSGDAPSWFEPAEGKTYKQQSAYGTVTAAAKASRPPRKGA